MGAYDRGMTHAIRAALDSWARTARLSVIVLAAGVPADLAVLLHSF
ncbi:hypothetical protein ACGFMK_22840 [Amycolatopsis sp. NPDC049252]